MGRDVPRLSLLIDRISSLTGQTAAWLTLAMVLVTTIVVVMRYVFGTGMIWIQESIVWMHATVFMLGIAYALQRDEHVRVDIFYRDMTATRRAWVDLLGVIFFLVPLCVFFLLESADYVSAAWRIGEVSRDAGGLPYPFVPLLKTMLLIMPLAVLLQALSMVLKAVAVLRGP